MVSLREWRGMRAARSKKRKGSSRPGRSFLTSRCVGPPWSAVMACRRFSPSCSLAALRSRLKRACFCAGDSPGTAPVAAAAGGSAMTNFHEGCVRAWGEAIQHGRVRRCSNWRGFRLGTLVYFGYKRLHMVAAALSHNRASEHTSVSIILNWPVLSSCRAETCRLHQSPLSSF
jgi:hypothetical protein